MISVLNQPTNSDPTDSDFTVQNYRQSITLAKNSYQAVNYRSIPWGQRFVLWRHDCDYSLNRSLVLARIEAELGLTATYFINPHCDFYNLLEVGQCALLQEIIALGHDIGLHFDSAFYSTVSEADLHQQVLREADLIEYFVGVRPAAFSFHNPSTFHLTCEADTYGGLVNCYSRRFKSEIPYCSDSNGYWRFRRLVDVLTEAKDPCLQVLTHPGWWQASPMPPRQRIFRSVYGRAAATMQSYDQGLVDGGRENLTGGSAALQFLKSINPELWSLGDYLWNSEHFDTLFVELWRLHERQIKRLCIAVFCKEWSVAAVDVNTFFENCDLAIDGSRLLEGVFGESFQHAKSTDVQICKDLVRMRNQMLHGRCSEPRLVLERGCIALCQLVESLAAKGMSQTIQYDGISHLDSIGILTDKTTDGELTDRLDELADEVSTVQLVQWERFKAAISKVTGVESMAEPLPSRADPPNPYSSI